MMGEKRPRGSSVTPPHWRDIRESHEDSEITAIRVKVESGDTSRYMLRVGVLYYLSGGDDEIRPRLFVPRVLRAEILEQCHEKMGHMGIDKVCKLISKNNYWPKLYNEVTAYVNSCVV